MAAGSDTPSRVASPVAATTLIRSGDIEDRAPEYPLERRCSHLYEPFQLKFARHAEQVLREVEDVQIDVSHTGLLLRAETEAALEIPVDKLRDFYGHQVRIGPAVVRYHRGVTLEQPYMGVRVRCRASDFEAIKADFEARQGAMVDSELTPSCGVVSVIVPLARLLGYPKDLARLTSGTAHAVMWLSHYAPVESPSPGHDAA